MNQPRSARPDRGHRRYGTAAANSPRETDLAEVPVPVVLRVGRVSRRAALGWHWWPPGLLSDVIDQLLEHGHRFVDLTVAARRISSHAVSAETGAEEAVASPELALLFEDSSLDFADLVWPVLQSRSIGCALAVESARVGRCIRRIPGPWPGSTRLSWSELAAFAAAGVEVVARGHFGVSHGHLPAELAFSDLLRCRREMEKRMGKAPAAFLHAAQPHPKMVDLVARAGFSLAIGSKPPRRGCSAWELGSVSVRRSDRPASLRRRLAKLPTPTVQPRSVDVVHRSSFSATAS